MKRPLTIPKPAPGTYERYLDPKPWYIRKIYTLRIFVERQTTWEKILSGSIPLILIIWSIFQNIDVEPGFLKRGYLLIILAATATVVYVSLLFTSHAGMKFVFQAKKYILIDDHHPFFEIKIDEQAIASENVFRFAKGKDADLVTQINIDAFHNTAWRATFLKKYPRNFSHIVGNDMSVLLIHPKGDVSENPLSRGFTGFTHTFPVSLYNWDKYKDGSIRDIDYDCHWVEPTPSGSSTRPHGLILFTAALLDSSKKMTRDEKIKAGDLILKAIALHINEFGKREFSDQEIIPVMFHMMDRRFNRYFKSLISNKRNVSKDKAKITIFEVLNPHFKHA